MTAIGTRAIHLVVRPDHAALAYLHDGYRAKSMRAKTRRGATSAPAKTKRMWNLHSGLSVDLIGLHPNL